MHGGKFAMNQVRRKQAVKSFRGIVLGVNFNLIRGNFIKCRKKTKITSLQSNSVHMSLLLALSKFDTMTYIYA